MPVRNTNSKVSAHPNLAAQLLQTFIPTRFNSILCQIRQSTLQPCPRRWCVRKRYGYQHKRVNKEIFIETFAHPKKEFSSKVPVQRQARRVLPKFQAYTQTEPPCFMHMHI